MTQTKIEPPGLAKLREPFPANQISKLPKETKAQIEQRKADKSCIIWKCPECGNAHHKNAVHLDYVGHAAATDRLLDADPEWTWEPVSFGQDGLPAFDRNGGLWIRLTVLGVTRLGYGDADGKTGGNAVKEIIGDAIRNAGMRFGMALDLWHKGDLHLEDESEGKAEPPQDQKRQPEPEGMPDAEWAKLANLVRATQTQVDELRKKYNVKSLKLLDQNQYSDAIDFLNNRLAEMAKAESNKAGATQEFADDDIPY